MWLVKPLIEPLIFHVLLLNSAVIHKDYDSKSIMSIYHIIRIIHTLHINFVTD